MMKILPVLFAVIVSCIAMWGCRSTPDNVLTQDEMADLMVDIHLGEAMADLQYTRFRDDSARAALRQAIYDRHGITQEDFDTSIAWYGHHIDKYMDLYDVVLERLEKNVERAGASLTGTHSLSGDSVDAWAESPYYVMSRRSPSNYLDFYIERDNNWKSGDSYTWQFKVQNRLSDMQVGIFVDYEDGSTDFNTLSVDQDGWVRTMIVLDSLRNPFRVYGYLSAEPTGDEEIFIDSLSLVRKSFDEMLYNRRFQQKKFRYGNVRTHAK